jgi:guanylate cyclase
VDFDQILLILFLAKIRDFTTFPTQIKEFKFQFFRTYKPSIQDKSKVHPDIASLLLDCWSSNPEIRPSIRRVRLNTENYLRVKGSLVDQMMRMVSFTSVSFKRSL